MTSRRDFLLRLVGLGIGALLCQPVLANRPAAVAPLQPARGPRGVWGFSETASAPDVGAFASVRGICAAPAGPRVGGMPAGAA